MKSGKVWGITQLVHSNSSFEFHRIEAKAGGQCSKHKHQHKWNGFFVESGSLKVRIWKETSSLLAGESTHVDETVLGPGDFLMVKPTEYHQFEAEEDTVAFELYWAEFNHDDIIREDHGKMKSNSISDDLLAYRGDYDLGVGSLTLSGMSISTDFDGTLSLG